MPNYEITDCNGNRHTVIALRYTFYDGILLFWDTPESTALEPGNAPVAAFHKPVAFSRQSPAWPGLQTQAVSFTVDGSEGDVRRLLNVWASNHGYKMRNLEITRIG